MFCWQEVKTTVAGFLLNGVLKLLSNFKDLNMHHILPALKLVSSHCNSSDLHRLSPVLQHGEVKGCFFHEFRCSPLLDTRCQKD